MGKHVEDRHLGRHMGLDSWGDARGGALGETPVGAVQGAVGDTQKDTWW